MKHIPAPAQVLRLKEFARLTRPVVEGLNDTNWDQEKPVYRPGREPLRHCLGVHLGVFFEADARRGAGWISYADGQRAAAQYLGCTTVELDWFICMAGGTSGPFLSSGWHHCHPSVVWKKLPLLQEVSLEKRPFIHPLETLSPIPHLERCLSLTHQTTH